MRYTPAPISIAAQQQRVRDGDHVTEINSSVATVKRDWPETEIGEETDTPSQRETGLRRPAAIIKLRSPRR
ncbi:hypothetical protein SKAU_G00356460 [Synaphobranchus kaupii]|uniref:Uncharacterized protein n=1 Tax=Synaphobranchus kaupii TaxID=118154 RepID=A0A9Q1EHI7_SYNKA|nr:hypothetical protein SKAU_G00356460 [Synaphobranchus kaupii]